MRRSVSISNLNRDSFGMDLEVFRFEYLPVATMKIDDVVVSDRIESFMEVAAEIEKGGNMRDVRLGDDNVFMSFVRQDGDNVVEVTMKNMDDTIIQKYDAEELAIAIRFITENSSSLTE